MRGPSTPHKRRTGRPRGLSPHQMGSQIQTNNNRGRRRNAYPMTERRLSIEASRAALLFALLEPNGFRTVADTSDILGHFNTALYKMFVPDGLPSYLQSPPFGFKSGHVPAVVSVLGRRAYIGTEMDLVLSLRQYQAHSKVTLLINQVAILVRRMGTP